MSNPIAFSTLACPGWPAETVVRQAAAYGYDALEWRGGPQGHVHPALPRKQVAGLRRQMAESGVAALALTAYTSFVSASRAEREASLDDLRRHCDLAAALDARYVRAFVGELPAGTRPESVQAQVVECLAAAARHARGVGVVIALEPHDDFVRASSVVPLLKQVPDPALGVIWDIGNAYAAGEVPAEGLALLRPRLAYVQVKDGRGQGATWRLSPLGEGDVPLAQAFELLLAGGYTGAVSVEWEYAWHPELDPPEVALPAALRAVRRWLLAAHDRLESASTGREASA